MSIFKCETDCKDHDYMFPHSVVTTTRMVDRVLVVTQFIICRACNHWIEFRGRCRCRFHCHEEEGGITVATSNDDAVD